MPEYFTWSKSDPYITSVLTAEEINKVAFWSKEDYEFSIHEGHEGWPLYIVPPGKRGKQPMPKIFLAPASYTGSVNDKSGWLSGQRAEKNGVAIGMDAKKVVDKNIKLFQKIAKHYYGDSSEDNNNNNNNKPAKKGEVLTPDTKTTPNTFDTLLVCKCGAKLGKTKHQPTDMEGKTFKCPKCGKSIYAK